MDSCIFCKIINKNIPGLIINESENVISFLSLENHPLIIPKFHIANIYSLDSKTGADLISEIINISRAIKKSLNCDGILVTQANESAAGQEVFHLHFHIYPKWHEKSKYLDKLSPNQKLDLVEKIKSSLIS